MKIILCLSLLSLLYINDDMDGCKIQEKNESGIEAQNELCHQYSSIVREIDSSNDRNEWNLNKAKIFLGDMIRWIGYYRKIELTPEGFYIPESDLQLEAWGKEGEYRYNCYYKGTPIVSIDTLKQYPIDSILIRKSMGSPAEKYAISEVERVVGHRLPMVYGYNSFPVYETKNALHGESFAIPIFCPFHTQKETNLMANFTYDILILYFPILCLDI